MKIAIVGASGFIGTRLVERLVLGREAEVVPVARAFSSLAVVARFALPWKVCDVFDSDALCEAFSGCEAVVHAALGDSAQIVKMAGSIYRGADKAGVRRLVVFSSASVHGKSPESGTDENSPINDHHFFDYNNAKVRAERLLRKLHRRGGTELVLLRPGIVYGPRSRFVSDIAMQLLDGTAYLVGEGAGLTNGIYVDNLIDAILLALDRDEADGEAFLVGDAERTTWRQFYGTIAEALDVDMSTVSEVVPPVFKKSRRERLDALVASPFAQKLLPFVPGRAKQTVKTLIASWSPSPQPDAWTLPKAPVARLDLEMCALQQCSWKYPQEKASALLGYSPSVSYDEGMRRSMEWLKFAGYQAAGRTYNEVTSG